MANSEGRIAIGRTDAMVKRKRRQATDEIFLNMVRRVAIARELSFIRYS